MAIPEKKSGKVKAKAKFVCKGGKKTCGLVLSDGDDSVRCDWCEDWYHPKCQGLTLDAFRALSKYDFVWVCLGCRPNFMSMQKQGKQLENRLDEVEDKILKAINASRGIESNKEVEEKLKALETNVVEKIKEQQTEVDYQADKYIAYIEQSYTTHIGERVSSLRLHQHHLYNEMKQHTHTRKVKHHSFNELEFTSYIHAFKLMRYLLQNRCHIYSIDDNVRQCKRIKAVKINYVIICLSLYVAHTECCR